MIGKIVGAIAGSQVARHVRGVDGTGGALLGVAATAVLRRMGPVGLIATAVGGYALKKYADRRKAAQTGTVSAAANARPTQTQA
ncbi:hypothetical protein [Novosphingobium sp. BL-52-GroH]|uniref:hypothetical protein n=1 Tax=Novosphingobium sp. BL-52-GroH TaxID=3349877 RepID=UPI00384DBFBF